MNQRGTVIDSSRLQIGVFRRGIEARTRLKRVECVMPCDERVWNILALPEVAAEVYNPSKQHGIAFNRNLVANIICMMKDAGIITETNVSQLTQILERDKDHSVRAALATLPRA